MATAMENSTKGLEACEAGEAFVKEFFTTMDRRRNLLAGFYYDSSFCVWNGHTQTGVSDVSTFYQSLPASEHEIFAFDCQPVFDTPGQTQVLITCQGQVAYDIQQNNLHQFSQNFMLTKSGEYWKISSDCFRFIET